MTSPAVQALALPASAPLAHDRVATLDGWRGAAIFALLIGHFVPGLGVGAELGMNFGRLGVELFFVLSGLLMGNLLFVKRVAIPVFYKKRVARIFPTLYGYVIVASLVLWMSGHAHALHSVASIFLLYFNYYAGSVGMNIPAEYGHIWSLCIEEHSYILLSLVAIVCRRTMARDYVIIAVLTLTSWACAAAYSALTDWDYNQLFWRTEARVGAVFISAGLVCWLREAKQPLIRGYAVVAAIVAGVLLQTRYVPDLLKYTLGTALLALGVTHLAMAPAAVRRGFEHPGLVALGICSYSIYLWQQPFLVASERHSRVLCLAGALVTGIVSYYLLETPARRFLNARWGRTAKQPA